MALPLKIGIAQRGEEKWVDLDASPHMLVAGTTGAGKSNFVEHYIGSLLEKGNCKLYIIDPSDDLYGYAGQKNVAYITCPQRAYAAVCEVEEELTKRAVLFRIKKRRTEN